MKIIRFREAERTLILKLETFEDLWSAQRIIFSNDIVKSKSLRKFKSDSSDKGEMKEVVVTLRVERTELDKTAQRLRILGKILDGRPLDYIKIGSYHTINAGIDDTIEISKEQWHSYVLDVVKNAVSTTRNTKLGIIAVDDEKALPAYLLGYGIEFRNQIYSNLSKRMTQKEYREQEAKYFESIVKTVERMEVSIVIIAGPGFTKENFKNYCDAHESFKKTDKRILYEHISNAERSGVYELVKSGSLSSILENERIRQEFMLMDEFLRGLSSKRSRYGSKGVDDAISNYEANIVIVNDSSLSDSDVQKVLNKAESFKLRVEVFNADDEVGAQLHGFNDIGCFWLSGCCAVEEAYYFVCYVQHV